ncbi:hypothetical protein, partial [Streptococcus pseudopneumoniae]|uniref:hypothetical protein n=1 Tax=Streptococcus pseudopneumoniae TaxID=257758 RepID=UPI0018B07492
MSIESKHKKELEKLAESMIRDEFNMSSDVVEIVCELTDNISLKGTKREKLPTVVEMEFDDFDSIQNANDNVYK